MNDIIIDDTQQNIEYEVTFENAPFGVQFAVAEGKNIGALVLEVKNDKKSNLNRNNQEIFIGSQIMKINDLDVLNKNFKDISQILKDKIHFPCIIKFRKPKIIKPKPLRQSLTEIDIKSILATTTPQPESVTPINNNNNNNSNNNIHHVTTSTVSSLSTVIELNDLTPTLSNISDYDNKMNNIIMKSNNKMNISNLETNNNNNKLNTMISPKQSPMQSPKSRKTRSQSDSDYTKPNNLNVNINENINVNTNSNINVNNGNNSPKKKRSGSNLTRGITPLPENNVQNSPFSNDFDVNHNSNSNANSNNPFKKILSDATSNSSSKLKKYS